MSSVLRPLTGSVFVKCLAFLALSTAIVATLLTVQATRMAKTIAAEDIEVLADETTHALADVTGGAIKFGKADDVRDKLTRAIERLRGYASEGIVVNMSSELLAAEGVVNEQEQQRLAALAERAKAEGVYLFDPVSLTAAAPVRFGPANDVVGAVSIRFSNDVALATLQAHLQEIVVIDTAVALVTLVVFGFALRSIISVPLLRVQRSMAKVADGDYGVDIPSLKRHDEIGKIARTLDDFRNALAEADNTKTMAEAERSRLEAIQEEMIDALRSGLSQLSTGDLTVRIDKEFAAENDRVRLDFNLAVETLSDAFSAILDRSGSIQSEVTEISSAADDLSRRTEHQAATLEQTAAALAEITASVSSAAEGARRANDVVTSAQSNAEASGGVVQDAVAAMGEISESSNKISSIISVIDDIAFQTNLLALNAGVEAARAGDAGRGFAVVASEVRALAQRSSDAAREINALISASGEHVERGVTLVGDAGEALKQIVTSVSGISSHVADIAASAQEQSSGLAEINAAMNQLDQVTQQNAAMFEETTAASQSLSSAAEDLSSRVSRFKVTRGTTAPAPSVKAPAKTPSVAPKPSEPADKAAAPAAPPPVAPKPAPAPVAATPAAAAPAAAASAAEVAEQELDDDWTEF